MTARINIDEGRGWQQLCYRIFRGEQVKDCVLLGQLPAM